MNVDRRDPEAMGELLLRVADTYRRTDSGPGADATLSEVADYAAGTLEDHVPLYRDPVSPVDRYGDQREPIERLADTP